MSCSAIKKVLLLQMFKSELNYQLKWEITPTKLNYYSTFSIYQFSNKSQLKAEKKKVSNFDVKEADEDDNGVAY